MGPQGGTTRAIIHVPGLHSPVRMQDGNMEKGRSLPGRPRRPGFRRPSERILAGQYRPPRDEVRGRMGSISWDGVLEESGLAAARDTHFKMLAPTSFKI